MISRAPVNHGDPGDKNIKPYYNIKEVKNILTSFINHLF